MNIKKNLKLEQLTPQTIPFEKGVPKLWLFNSKKAKGFPIYKKNSDKLNILEVARSMLQVPGASEWKVDNLQGIYEIFKLHRDFNNPELVVFMRLLKQQTRSMTRQDFIKFLIDGKELTQIAFLQTYICNHSKANELYYTEYRKENDTLPPVYKFYKKTLTRKQQAKQLDNVKTVEQANPFSPLILTKSQAPKQKIMNQSDEMIKVIFKYFDASLNQTFQEKTNKVVEYFQTVFQIKIQKLICKFVIDIENTLYFIGVKELLISIPQQAPYNIKQLTDDLLTSAVVVESTYLVQFENFMNACKEFKLRPNQNKQNIPKLVIENSKAMSQTLYRNLILQKCQGDFCDYIMMERNKGPLQLRKGVAEKYKSAFNTVQKEETLQNIATSLPYEIQFQLILRARECSDDVILLFQKNKISLRQNYLLDEGQKQDIDVEFPFRKYKREVFNLENLYKTVKICKNCFVFYAMIAKYFDKSLKLDLKRRTWNQLLPTIENTNTDANSKIMKPIPETMMDDEDRDSVVQEGQSKGFHGNNIPKRSQSEQQFRLPRKLNEKKPIKVYVVPKYNESLQIKQKGVNQSMKREKTAQQMTVNRLALGYLNYQQLDIYKSQTIANKERVDSFQRPPSLQDEQQISNLIALLANERSEPTRKLDSNANENVHLLKLSDDLRNMKKRVTNDSDVRQLHQQYCSTKLNEGQLEHIFTTSYFYYHANFQHLKKIHKFRLTTPLQPITDELKYNKLRPLTIEMVCTMMSYTPPAIQIPDIRYHIYDEKTAIPFVLLQGRITIPKGARNGNNKQSGVQVIIILTDIFESLHDYFNLCLEELKSNNNIKIILINFPGQAYTIFSTLMVYSNLVCSEMIDQILFTLQEEQSIYLDRDEVKIMGIGNGGFIAQTFVCESSGHIPFLNKIVLVNSFNKVDEQLKQLFNRSKQIFGSHSSNMPELPYEYYGTLVNSTPLTSDDIELMIMKNPIKVKGRIVLINGLLSSNPIADRFERVLITVQIYHSLQNCLINIAEADYLTKFIQDDVNEMSTTHVTKKLASTTRTVEYLEGGHCILQENLKFLNIIIKKMIQ